MFIIDFFFVFMIVGPVSKKEQGLQNGRAWDGQRGKLGKWGDKRAGRRVAPFTETEKGRHIAEP